MDYEISAEAQGDNTFRVSLPDRTTTVEGMTSLQRLLGSYQVVYDTFETFKSDLLKTGKASVRINPGKGWQC